MIQYLQQNQLIQPVKKFIQDYSYSLNDILGRGFSSTVYKGVNERNGEIVAIKVVDTRTLQQDVQRMVLQNEIETLKKLKCENTLKLYDVYYTVNNTYIITEFCEQGDLGSFLKQNGRLQEKDATAVLLHLINGLVELEKHGVAHRDLKPDNILIKGNIPKIADFGFSKQISQIKPSNQEFNVGTPLYMSPETLLRNQYSNKTDIWSLGVIYFEMIFGQAPWQVKTEEELTTVITQPIQFPSSPYVSGFTKDVIKLTLTVDSNSRIDLSQLRNLFNQDSVSTQASVNASRQRIIKNQNHSPIEENTKQSYKKLNQNAIPQNPPFQSSQSEIQIKIGRQRQRALVQTLNKEKSQKFFLNKSKDHKNKSNIELKPIPQGKNDLTEQCDRIIQAQIDLCNFLEQLLEFLQKMGTLTSKWHTINKLRFLVSKNIMIVLNKLKEQVDNDTKNPLKLQLWKDYCFLNSYQEKRSLIFDKHYKAQEKFNEIFSGLSQNQCFVYELDYDFDFDAIFDVNLVQYPSFYLILQIFLTRAIKKLNHQIIVEFKPDIQNIQKYQNEILLLNNLYHYLTVIKIMRNNLFDPYTFTEQSQGKLQLDQNQRIDQGHFTSLRHYIKKEMS